MIDGGSRSRTSGFRAFAAAYTGSVIAASLRRAAGVYVGIATICAVVFGPTGMRPSDVTHAAQTSVGFRLGLWAVWILALAPAARVLFRHRAIAYLRSLPVAAAWSASLAGGALLALQIPWIALFAADRPISAAAAGAGAAGVHGLIAMRGRLRWLGVAAIGGLVASPAPAAVVAAAGAAALMVAIPSAWARSVERGGARGLRIRGGRLFALAFSHGLAIVRRQPSALARAAIIAAVGGGLVALSNRANDYDLAELALFSLAVATVTLSIAVGAIAGALIEAERAARWLLDSTGTGGGARVGACAMLAGTWGAILGAIHGGVALSTATAMSNALVVAEGAVLGCALSLIAVRGARWAERREGIDGSRVVVTMVPVAVAMLVGVGWVGELALVPLVGLAILATASSARLAAVAARRWEIGRRRRGIV